MCVRSSVFLCEIMLISLCYTEQVCNYGDPQRVRNVKLSRGSGSGDHNNTSFLLWRIGPNISELFIRHIWQSTREELLCVVVHVCVCVSKYAIVVCVDKECCIPAACSVLAWALAAAFTLATEIQVTQHTQSINHRKRNLSVRACVCVLYKCMVKVPGGGRKCSIPTKEYVGRSPLIISNTN